MFYSSFFPVLKMHSPKLSLSILHRSYPIIRLSCYPAGNSFVKGFLSATRATFPATRSSNSKFPPDLTEAIMVTRSGNVTPGAAKELGDNKDSEDVPPVKSDIKNELEELRKWWCGAFVEHEHSSTKNIQNALICLLAFVPSIAISAWVLTYRDEVKGAVDEPSTIRAANAAGGLRAVLFHSPLLLVNTLFFVNVDVLFFVIGLLQKSFWLIDPYVAN